jgi:hypothetical protein
VASLILLQKAPDVSLGCMFHHRRSRSHAAITTLSHGDRHVERH